MSHIASQALFVATADATITNTTVETTAIPSGVGNLTLPSDWMAVGRAVRLRGHGIYSTPAVTGGTVTVRLKVGSTTIASLATSALLVGASSAAFQFEALVVFRAVGASGSVIAGGNVNYETTAGRVFDNLNNAGAVTTVDTTADRLLDVTVQWDTASASKIVKVTAATAEDF